MNIMTGVLLFFIMITGAHDIQIATFTFFHQEGLLHLEVTLDLEDVAQELQTDMDEINVETLSHYLQAHTDIIINNDRAELKLTSSHLNGPHITLDFFVSGGFKTVRHIEIHNSCLLTLDDQSNIIRFRLYDVERDFLMNEQRQIIKVAL